MDLGIAGRKAIMCASSRGLGRACAKALAEAGCEVVINGRDRERLAATAAELQQATGARITPVASSARIRRPRSLAQSSPASHDLPRSRPAVPIGFARSSMTGFGSSPGAMKTESAVHPQRIRLRGAFSQGCCGD
jgi:hypothetical protein